MKNNTTPQKVILTSAAKEMLDDIANEHKTKLISKVLNQTNFIDTEKITIGVRDILEVVTTDKKIFRKNSRPLFSELILFASFLLIVSVLSLYVFSSYVDNRVSFFQSDTPIIILAGLSTLLTFSAAMVAIPSLFRSRISIKSRSDVMVTDYLLVWRNVEILLRENYSRLFGESMASAPFRVIISKLVNRNILDIEFANALSSSLSFRNELVHNDKFYDVKILSDRIRECRALYFQLQKAFK